jgi:hypothetical protein
VALGWGSGSTVAVGVGVGSIGAISSASMDSLLRLAMRTSENLMNSAFIVREFGLISRSQTDAMDFPKADFHDSPLTHLTFRPKISPNIV